MVAKVPPASDGGQAETAPGSTTTPLLRRETEMETPIQHPRQYECLCYHPGDTSGLLASELTMADPRDANNGLEGTGLAPSG